MDKQIFGKGMALLSALYPDYPLKDETMETYWEFLRDMANLDFERAVKGHVRTCKWFPKVSELLEASRAHLPTAHDVMNQLLAAAEAGLDEPPLSPAGKAALGALGGWEAFQVMRYEDISFRFKEFRTAYLEAQARENLALVGSEQKVLGEK
jgi:hypothetical protein